MCSSSSCSQNHILNSQFSSRSVLVWHFLNILFSSSYAITDLLSKSPVVLWWIVSLLSHGLLFWKVQVTWCLRYTHLYLLVISFLTLRVSGAGTSYSALKIPLGEQAQEKAVDAWTLSPFERWICMQLVVEMCYSEYEFVGVWRVLLFWDGRRIFTSITEHRSPPQLYCWGVLLMDCRQLVLMCDSTGSL